MDMKALLEKMIKFAGEPEQKPGDQVRGTEKAKKGKDHPFKGRLVGDSVEPLPNMLGELDKYSKETVIERSLAERWEEFKEAAFKDTEARRPARKGSRPGREYTKDGKLSKRYTYSQEETDESRGHKIIARKLADIERKPSVPSADDDAARTEQAKADYAKYVAKMKKKDPNFVPLYKMDENVPTGQTTMADKTGMNDPKQVAKVAQATQVMRAATGSNAPASNIAKALDTAGQGTAVAAKDMKVIEPMIDVLGQVAQDPKLANQFKSLAAQATQMQQQQAKQSQQQAK